MPELPTAYYEITGLLPLIDRDKLGPLGLMFIGQVKHTLEMYLRFRETDNQKGMAIGESAMRAAAVALFKLSEAQKAGNVV